MGVENDIFTSEKDLAGSYKTKHTQTLFLSNSITRYLPKRNENITLQKDLYENVRSVLFMIAPSGNSPGIQQEKR